VEPAYAGGRGNVTVQIYVTGNKFSDQRELDETVRRVMTQAVAELKRQGVR
jgi:hypothetical protein